MVLVAFSNTFSDQSGAGIRISSLASSVTETEEQMESLRQAHTKFLFFLSKRGT